MGCQKLKTRRVRFQQKQREPEQRGGCSVVAYKPMGRVSVLRSPETASTRNRSRRCAGGQTVVHNKLPQPDTTTTTPRATTQARAGALMFPASCLDGSITRVGPGLNPQYTRAWCAREAARLLTQQLSTDAQMSPTLQHVSLFFFQKKTCFLLF